ncbi:MAG: GNAT family N-acetyltransferase [Actinobacteria bacterium]|nr:GNAT family N-acetyltransferase [Actinomycetota bacterium]
MTTAFATASIRRVEESSPPEVWDQFLGILVAYWSESFPDNLGTPEWRGVYEERMRRRLQEHPTWLWLYERDGRPIAMANFYVVAGRAHIAEFYVVPPERRHGLGRFLIDAMKNTLRTVGVSRLEISLPHHATDKCDFWRASGFTEVAVQMESAIR